MTRSLWMPGLAALAAGLLAASPAAAQDYGGYDHDPDDDYDEYGFGPERSIVPRGAGVSLGGGVAGFTDTELRDMTNSVGGAWEARLTYGTRSLLGVEAAYIGNAIGVDTLGVSDDAALVGNGGEINARLNFGIFRQVQPYLIAGIGVIRYDLQNTGGTNTSNLADDDTVGLVPVGAGVGYRLGGLMLDLRAGVRASFDDDLVADGDDATTLSTWNADLRVGWEF